MAWQEVEATPEYQQLPAQARERLKLDYFDERVAPSFKPEELHEARRAFFEGSAEYRDEGGAVPRAIDKVLGGRKTAQFLAGAQKGATMGLSEPDYVDQPQGFGEHAARLGGEAAALLAPGALASKAALPVRAAVEGLVPAAEGAAPSVIRRLMARAAPVAAQEAVAGAGLGAARAEGETHGEATPGQVLENAAMWGAGGAAGGTLAAGAGMALDGPGARLSMRIRSRFPGIFGKAEEIKAGAPGESPAQPTIAQEPPMLPSGPDAPPIPDQAAPGVPAPEVAPPAPSAPPAGPEPAPSPAELAPAGASQVAEPGSFGETARRMGAMGELRAPGEAPPAATPDDMAGNIRLEKFAAPENVKGFMRQIAEDQPEALAAARRGTITNEETAARAAVMTGKDVDHFLKAKPGSILNAEDLHLAQQLLEGKTGQVLDLQQAISAGADDAASQLKFRLAMEEQFGLQQVVAGAKAEVGRALQAQKMIKQALMSNDERLMSRTLEHLGGRRMSDAEVAALAAARASGDPADVYRAMAQLAKPSAGEYVHAIVYNSLLSNPKTHQANAISNAFTNAARLLRVPVRGAVDFAMSKITGREQEAFIRETGPAIQGLFRGIPDGYRKALFMLKNGVSLEDVTKMDFARREVLPGAALNAPMRGIAAVDNFSRAIASQSEIYAQATRQAIKDGAKDVAAAAAKYVESPTPEMLRAAEEAGKEVTFTQDFGPLTRKLKGIVDFSLRELNPKYPDVRPMAFIVPFMRVSTNIMKEGVKYGGGGFATALGKTGAAASDDVAKAMMGSATGLYFATKLLEGKMWGRGPVGGGQPEKDKFLREHGGVQYAIDVGGEAVSFERFGEPFNTLAKAMANAHDVAVQSGKHPSPTDTAKLAFAFGAAMTDNSFTAGLARLVDAVEGAASGKGGAFTPFVQQTATSFIPFSGTGRYAAQALDPTVRDTRGNGVSESVVNAVKAIIPGVSESLPARRDLLGDPVVRKGGTIQPFKTAPLEQDEYTKKLAGMDMKLPGAPSRLGDRSLPARMQEDLLEARGERIKKVLDRMAPDDGDVNPARRAIIAHAIAAESKKVNEHYRARAELDALGFEASDDNARRVRALVSRPWFKKLDDEARKERLGRMVD